MKTRKAPKEAAQSPSDDQRFMFDVDVERALLASAWLAGAGDVVRMCDERDFTDPVCRWLWRHLSSMAAAGEPLDMVALLRRLNRPGGLVGLAQGDREYIRASLAEVLTAATTGLHAGYYFRVLRRLRLARALYDLAGVLRSRLTDGSWEGDEALAWALSQMKRLEARANPQAAESANCQLSQAAVAPPETEA